VPNFLVNQNFDNPRYNGSREMILIRQIDKMLTHIDPLVVF